MKCSHCGVLLRARVSKDLIEDFIQDRFCGDITLDVAEKMLTMFSAAKIEADKSNLKKEHGQTCKNKDHVKVTI